ncbi:MAG: 30S ribosome-binding factor RbfA [Patescibacteria group bacterium]
MAKRIQRVNALIKEEISQIILKEIEFSPGVLVTVTRAETTDDLRDSNVFISVLPDKDLSKIVDFLNRRAGFLQSKINKVLRMKPIPRLKFVQERETAEAGRIEELLEQLKKESK